MKHFLITSLFTSAAIYSFLAILQILDNMKEYGYYPKVYKTLKDKKYVNTVKNCYVWSTTDGILPEFKNLVTFNTDLRTVRGDKFVLSPLFPDCLDPYQFYWWVKYWSYYKKHIKPFLT